MSDAVELMNLYCKKMCEADEELKKLKEWELRAVQSMDAACEAIGVECCDEIPNAVKAMKSMIEHLTKSLVLTQQRDAKIISFCGIWGGEAMRVVPMLSTQTDFSIDSEDQTQSR